MTGLIETAALFVLGMGGGMLSGLLGIGGGIVMLPLLVTVPPLAGVSIALRAAVGITMLQSLVGSASALLMHRKNRTLDPLLTLVVGGCAAVASLGGSVVSSGMSERSLAELFAALAIGSLVLLLLPEPRPFEVAAPRLAGYPVAGLVGGGVGFFAGIVGQGGGFLLLPLMVRVFRVPLRTAIGSTCGVAFLSALTGFLGKWGTGQVPLGWAVAVSCGALVGGVLGGMLNRRMSTQFLENSLLLVVVMSAGRLLMLAVGGNSLQ
ncbi:sulfite exporter TauE/SafE family protein [Geomesophilobacter sediminis]|uniref:Probable membrane transporter protein n=1 Tax=Geomesophilobacter sediminis TaxID=2798584 RepID=A0A8J7J176_9BACT|nr:sulfite exporter TauE/SafE family protein [Geomesophilobacter sediminis]MBJ6724363.1 sulfite exporter TauE/SafE family protein [Geomesophilobacter sediminis]